MCVLKIRELGLWCWMPLSTIFQLYRGFQIYWRSTRRKPLTCRKSLTRLYHIMLYWVHIAWTGFELTTLVVIGTDCIGSYTFNYLMITTTMALEDKSSTFTTKYSIKSSTFCLVKVSVWGLLFLTIDFFLVFGFKG